MISTIILVIVGNLEIFFCGNFDCWQNASAERFDLFQCLHSGGTGWAEAQGGGGAWDQCIERELEDKINSTLFPKLGKKGESKKREQDKHEQGAKKAKKRKHNKEQETWGELVEHEDGDSQGAIRELLELQPKEQRLNRRRTRHMSIEQFTVVEALQGTTTVGRQRWQSDWVENCLPFGREQKLYCRDIWEQSS